MSGLSVHLNGRVVPAEQAVVSVWDAGFLHGASAFTTMFAHHGVVFRLDRHLGRLMDTVAKMRLRTDATPEGLAASTGELLAANGLREARVRITLTPGGVDDTDGAPTTLITAGPVPDHPAQWYAEGITVTVSSFCQFPGDPTFGCKTGCYFPRIFAQQAAATREAQEALWYTPDDHLAEACFCNVFLVRGGRVRTPPLSTPVLPGIVREAVLELCEELGIACDDQTGLTVQDMLSAEEIFLTASVSGIRPVVKVEQRAVGAGAPGAVTKKLMSAYRDLLEAECPPQENGRAS